MSEYCPSDINNDGCINNADLTEVVLQWSRPNPCVQGRICSADVNFDCTVNIDDLTAVILSWCSYCDGCTGLPCSTCCPPPYPCPGGGSGAMAGGGDDGAGDSEMSGQMTLAYLLSLAADRPEIVQAILESDLPSLLPSE